MHVIDLTATIETGMPVYPGDPEVRVTAVASLEQDGYAVHRIEMSSQSGTHVETQAHMVPGRTLSDEPLKRFIGEAAVVDVPCRALTVSDVEPFRNLIERCPFLILRSNYSPSGTRIDPSDEARPLLNAECAEWIVERGVRLVGIDQLGLDTGPTYEAHYVLLRKGVLIVEGLVNLRALSRETVRLFVIPMKIAGVEGAPCRAFAVEEE